jgi:hypothetical protein
MQARPKRDQRGILNEYVPQHIAVPMIVTPRISLQRHFSALTKFAHVASRFAVASDEGKQTWMYQVRQSAVS